MSLLHIVAFNRNTDSKVPEVYQDTVTHHASCAFNGRVTISLKPVDSSRRFQAWVHVNGHPTKLLGTYRDPEHAACRALLDEGCSPGSYVEFFHCLSDSRQTDGRGAAFPAFRGKVGKLARLTVTERDNPGLRVEPYKPFPPLESTQEAAAEGSRIASEDSPATHVPDTTDDRPRNPLWADERNREIR